MASGPGCGAAGDREDAGAAREERRERLRRHDADHHRAVRAARGRQHVVRTLRPRHRNRVTAAQGGGNVPDPAEQ